MMELWETLVVVALALLSGALGGIGAQDLRRSRAGRYLGSSGSTSQGQATSPSPFASDNLDTAVSSLLAFAPTAKPGASAPDLPLRPRPRLWFVDPLESETGTSESPPLAETSDPVVKAEEPKETATALSIPAIAPIAEVEATGLSIPALKPAVDEAGPANTIDIDIETISAARTPPPVRLSKRKDSGWIQRLGASMHNLNFWIEFALLVLLLIGAVWGVAFFVTFPSPHGK